MLKGPGLVLVTLISLSLLTGCGGSSQKPPVTPAFSNASLNGSYVFSVTGTNSGPYTLLGTFEADGKGRLTGNTDYNSPSTGFVEGNFPFTGSYSVSSDGTATANLTGELLGPVALPVTLEFVLLSERHGLVARFENSATASGSLDKRDPSAYSQASLAGTWVFNAAGTDHAGLPEAVIGSFTVDSEGTATGGVQDTNDNGVIHSNIAVLPGHPSSMVIDPTLGYGLIGLVMADGSIRDLSAFVIDNDHIRVVCPSFDVLVGDAFRATGPSISGSFAFAMNGTASTGAFAAGGVMNTDGAGNILNTSVEDINNGGTVTLNSALNGAYSIAGNRATITLNGGATNLVAYPSTGGLQLLDLDNSTVANGVALQQTGAFSNTTLVGRYGASLSGAGGAGQFDALAQFTSNGNGLLAGSLSLNDSGSLMEGQPLSGAYVLGANGRATGSLVTASGSQSLIYYFASGSQALFIEADSNRVSQGTLLQQQ